MGKIIFLILISHLFIKSLNAQWIQQYPVTSGVALRDVEFIDRYTGWACGDGGLILKTTNGGTNWIIQPTPAVGKPLFNIHPVNSQVLYCVGYFQTILKSTNGGNDWIVIRNDKVGSPGSLIGVFFINENTGWISGTLGRILKTTDGGDSFDSTGVFWGYMKDIYFKDANTGLISADFAGMFKTTDGGKTWNQKTIPYHGGIGDFRKLSVVNNEYVYVVEDARRVFRSTNFGDTWDSVGFVNGADDPYACGFANELVGFVGGTKGEMYKTTDGGSIWKKENNNDDHRFVMSFWLYDELTIWAVGGGTKIFFTETGGMTNVKQVSNIIPNEFNLHQNYSNPFNSRTIIRFDVPKNGIYKLEVFDALGRKLDEVFNKSFTNGSYEVSFDAQLLSSGVYFYKLTNDGFSNVRKFVLMK